MLKSKPIVIFALALHFFNLSIDSKDKYHQSIQEDLTLNDIESIVEFFAEEILGNHNVFQEHDEADSEILVTSSAFTFYFTTPINHLGDSSLPLLYTHHFKSLQAGKISPSSGKISSPPPKA